MLPKRKQFVKPVTPKPGKKSFIDSFVTREMYAIFVFCFFWASLYAVWHSYTSTVAAQRAMETISYRYGLNQYDEHTYMYLKRADERRWLSCPDLKTMLNNLEGNDVNKPMAYYSRTVQTPEYTAALRKSEQLQFEARQLSARQAAEREKQRLNDLERRAGELRRADLERMRNAEAVMAEESRQMKARQDEQKRLNAEEPAQKEAPARALPPLAIETPVKPSTRAPSVPAEAPQARQKPKMRVDQASYDTFKRECDAAAEALQSARDTNAPQETIDALQTKLNAARQNLDRYEPLKAP